MAYSIQQETGDFLLQEIGDKLGLDGYTFGTITKDLGYYIKATEFITKTGKYAVLTTPSAKTKSLQYTVKTTTEITKSLQYIVISPVAQNKSLKYSVLTTPTATDKGLIYRIFLQTVELTKSLAYIVVSAVTPQKSLKYTVISSPKIDLGLTYVTGTQLTVTKSLKYTVTSTATAVTKSLEYQVTLGSTTVNKSLTYAVVTSTAVNQSLKYAIFAPVAPYKSLTYTVLTSDSQSKSLAYAVKITPNTITKSLSYRIGTNVYWYGGTGNWSDTSHWSKNPGNSPASPLGHVPTSLESVNFDSQSSATAYTVTVNTTANCLDFNMAAPASGKVTWAGGSTLNINGNLKLSGGSAGITRTTTSLINFVRTTGTQDINTYGVSFNNRLYFTGVGGTVTLQSNLTNAYNGVNLSLAAGAAFDANGYTVTLESTTNSTVQIIGNFTFYNLTMAGSTTRINNLIITDNITVTNLLSLNGNSEANRIFVTSLNPGSTVTITAANVSTNNTDFMDITAAGASIPWSGTSLGDCLGNTNITFATPVDRYSVAAGAWSSNATWSATSGGASGVTMPLPQDTIYMEGSYNISHDVIRSGKDVYFDGRGGGAAYTGTLSTGGAAKAIFGTMVVSSGTNWSGVNTWDFRGRSAGEEITSNGKAFTQSINIIAPNGTYTLTDNLTTTDWTQTIGTVVDAGYTIEVNGVSIIWNYIAGTFTQTGTIKATTSGTSTRFFNGDYANYNNLWITGTGTGQFAFLGSNTLNEIKDDSSVAHELQFASGTTQTVTNFDVNGTPGNLITITTRNSTTVHYLVKAGGGTISCNYLNIQHSRATPTNTWYANLNNSVNNQSVPVTGSGWIFLATTAKAKTLRYVIIGKPYINKNLTYSIITPPVIDKTLKYCVQSNLSDPTRFLLQENGDFLLQENGDKIILEGDLWIRHLPLTYSIILITELTKSLAYYINVVTPITKTLQYRTSIFATEITKSLQYTVPTYPSSIDIYSQYCILNAANIVNKSLTYDVVRPQAINKTLTYEVVAPVAITKSLKYTINTALEITKSLQYSIKTIIAGITKSLKYTIVDQVAKTKSLKYTIKTTFSQSKSLRYAVVTQQTINKSLKYNLKSTHLARGLRLDYRIITNFENVELYHKQNQTYTSGYATVGNTYTYLYRTEERHGIAKTLKYVIWYIKN